MGRAAAAPAGGGDGLASLRAFDALAASYDARFTDHPVGRRLRARTWAIFDALVAPGARALDLGCGTGVDARHLAARGVAVVGLDPSPAMLAVARAAPRPAGAGAGPLRYVEGTLEARVADGTFGQASFDAAIANFGVLNAAPDPAALGAALARVLRPGAPFVAVVMGPVCAWEIACFVARGAPLRALRRLRRGGARVALGAASLVVRYPRPGRLAAALGPGLRAVECTALGALLPPTWAADWLARRPKWLAALDRADRAVARRAAAVALADHYVLVLERRP